MLSITKDHVLGTGKRQGEGLNPEADVHLFGQEVNPDEFIELAAANAIRNGGIFKQQRWHCKDGDFVYHDGGTFAFSNQWGGRWHEAMDSLKSTFPKVSFEYRPTQ
jgi:hypothetical protein